MRLALFAVAACFAIALAVDYLASISAPVPKCSPWSIAYAGCVE